MTQVQAGLNNITINGSDNTTFDQAFTVNDQIIIDDFIFTNTVDVAAASVTLKGSTLSKTLTINANSATIGADGDRNTFNLAGGDIGITSDSGNTDNITGLNISYNDFASSNAAAYTGIDLGDDFASNAITMTDNDMTTPITVGIKLASGTATITKSNITSAAGAGIGIQLAGGTGHNIGTADTWANRNTLSNLAAAIQIDDGTVVASTVTVTFNDLSTGNTLEIDNNDANAVLSAIKNFFSVITDPVAKVDNNTDYVNYSPWCSNNSCGAFTQDISNSTQSLYYGASQFNRALSEANVSDTLTFDNAITYASKDINKVLTLTGNNNATFDTALTISAAAILDNVNINTDTTISAGATIKNSDISKTLSIQSNDVKIGTAGNGNTFTLADTDTGITSPNSAGAYSGLSIIGNSFKASVAGQSYTGIDLKNDFADQTMTLTNNDMSTGQNDVITVGIKIDSGTATITSSEIDSTGPAGIGIHLTGGATHRIGATDALNTLTDLASAITVDNTLDASTLIIEFNKITSNTVGITNSDDAIATAYKNWWGANSEPNTSVNDIALINYGHWCTAEACATFNEDIAINPNVGSDRYYGRLQVERAFDEVTATEESAAITMDGGDYSLATISSVSDDLTITCTEVEDVGNFTNFTAGLTIAASNVDFTDCKFASTVAVNDINSSFTNGSMAGALTIGAATTLVNNVTVNSTIAINAASATIQNSDLNAVVTISATGATLSGNAITATTSVEASGASITGNTYSLAGGDIGITSPNTTGGYASLSVTNNSFASSNAAAYTGIDLKDDFVDQTITLTNNDMTSPITTGIKVASGTATITNSEIDSNETGVGIHLTGGTTHRIGATDALNTLTDLASAITIDNTLDASTLIIEFNKITSNTVGITNSDDAIATAYKNWWGANSEPNTSVNDIALINYGHWCTAEACATFNEDIAINPNVGSDRYYGRLQVERAFDEVTATEESAAITMDGGDYSLATISSVSDDLTITCTEVEDVGNFTNFTAGLTIAASNVDFTNCKFASTVAVNDINSSFTNGSITGALTIGAATTLVNNVTVGSTIAINAASATIQNSTVTGATTISGANSILEASTFSSPIDVKANNAIIRNNTAIKANNDQVAISSSGAGPYTTITISNNTIQAVDADNDSYEGVNLANKFTGTVTISDNTLSNNLTHGITITAATDLVMELNSITSSDGGVIGLDISGVTNSTTIGNPANDAKVNTIDGFATGINLANSAALHDTIIKNASTVGLKINSATATVTIDDHTSNNTNALGIDINAHAATTITGSTFNLVD